MKKLPGIKKTVLLFLIAIFAVADFFVISSQRARADDVSEIQDKLDQYQDKKEAVQKELDTAQTLLQKTQYQMNVTKDLIQKTENEMTRKESEINNLKSRIELNRKILESYIQEMYIGKQETFENFLVSESKISDDSASFDQMIGLKEKILALLDDISQSKQDLENVKTDLEDKKTDHEQLLNIQQGQQYQLKSDVSQAQASLAQLNAKIEKLRGELSSLLGSAISFKNIMDAAKFAAKVTDIRKDYLLGVLVVESNLGRYTGGCTFKESNMSSYRAGIFKNICKELDYNYQKMKVSCPPKGYKGTGGAMGVAQFMPDTWMGYKSSIASVTGHNPPDPWDLTDGVVAMALKLSKVSGVTAHKESAEAKAYCVYLAGNNWASYCDNKGTNYGELVLYWADNYERLMN